MSTLTWTSTTKTVTFTFSGFENPISNYTEIGITDRSFTNGGTSLMGNYRNNGKTINNNSYELSISSQLTGSSMVAGTDYTFYGYAKYNGKYYYVGSSRGVEVSLKKPSSIKVYFHDDTNVTFLITTSEAINSANYQSIGVTNKSFENGASSLRPGATVYSTSDFWNGQSTQIYFTVTDLSPGTKYTFYGFAQAANGKYYTIPENGTSISVTTDRESSEEPTLECIKRHQDDSEGPVSLDFRVTVPPNTQELTFQISKSNTFTSTINVDMEEKSITDRNIFTDEGNGKYVFTVTPNDNNYGIFSTILYARASIKEYNASYGNWNYTQIVMPPSTLLHNVNRMKLDDSISINDKPILSLYSKLLDKDGGYDNYPFTFATFEIFEVLDTSEKVVTLTHVLHGNNITTLPPGTTRYIMNFRDFANGQKNGVSVSNPINAIYKGVFTFYYQMSEDTTPLPPFSKKGNESHGWTQEEFNNFIVISKPVKFNWHSSNGEATTEQTIASHAAVTNKGSVSAFSYKVWNDMCNKVNEILDYSGNTWISTSPYLSLSDTKMSPTNKTLTATRYNSLKTNIGQHYPTDLEDKTSGEPVYGDYMTLLVDKMNDWIDFLE